MGRSRDLLAARLRVRRPTVREARSTFDDLLRQHENDRDRRFIESVVPPSFASSRNPPGWRAEDILGEARTQGFVLLAHAAEAMAITETEALRLVAEGKLEMRNGRVRPAIIAVLHVRG